MKEQVSSLVFHPSAASRILAIVAALPRSQADYGYRFKSWTR
jgi:hypothetical protein